MNDRPKPRECRSENSIEELVQQFILEALENKNPDVEAYCAMCPEQAEGLRLRLHAYQEIDATLNQISEGCPEGRSDSDQWVGRCLDDFEVIREIGRGGMGIVFLARQVSLNRMVALKVLGPHQFFNEHAVERFHREASTVAKLQHPNIATVFAVGESAGFHYYAMEYIEGVSLDKVVAALREAPPDSRASRVYERVVKGEWAVAASDSPEPHDLVEKDERKASFWDKTYIEKSCTLVTDVALALQHAHAHGIIHRDVKPSNILITRQGIPKLVDFGLAKEMGAASLTASHELFGTPYYMAPEQVQRSRGEIDHRTDIYSLGATLYELLTLHRPFEGSTSQEVLTKIANERPEPPRRINPALSRDLNTVVLHCLEDRPSARYPSAAALTEDLDRLLSYRPIVARPPSVLSRLVKMVRRRPAHAAVVLTVILCVGLAVGFGLAYAKFHREKQARLEREIIEEASLAMEEGCSALMRTLGGHTRMLQDKTGLGIRNELLQDANRHFNHVTALDPEDPIAPIFSAASSLFLGEDPGLDLENHAGTVDPGKGMTSAVLLRAWSLERLGQHAKAASLMKSFGNRTPSSAEDALILSYIYSMAGLSREALKHYESAIGYDSANYWALLGRAMCRGQLGQRDLALQDLAVAHQIAPNRADTWIARGVIEDEIGDLRQAIAYYEKAAALEPTNGALRFQLGMLLCWAGRREEGFASFDEALRLHRTPFLAVHVAVLREMHGDLEGGIEIVRSCTNQYPETDTPLLILYELLTLAGREGEAEKVLARIEERSKPPLSKRGTDGERARECHLAIRKHLLGEESDAARVKDSALFHGNRGTLKALSTVLAQGVLTSSFPYPVRSVDWLAPSRERQLHDSALIQLAQEGDIAEVRRCGLNLLQCSNPVMSELVAKHFERAGLKEEALSAYNRAISLNPKYGEARAGLASLLMNLKRPREAGEQWTLLRRSCPYDVRGYATPAQMLLQEQRWDEAELHYLLGLERMSSSSVLHWGMAFSLVQLGRFEEATTCAEKCMAFSDAYNPPEMWPIVGFLLLKGEKSRAVALCQRLVGVRPKCKEYRECLERALAGEIGRAPGTRRVALIPKNEIEYPAEKGNSPEDWWYTVALTRIMRTQSGVSPLEDFGLLAGRAESPVERTSLTGLLRRLEIDALCTLALEKDQTGKMSFSVTVWRIVGGQLTSDAKKSYILESPEVLSTVARDLCDSIGLAFAQTPAMPAMEALTAEWPNVRVLGEAVKLWATGEDSRVQIPNSIASSTWLGSSLRGYLSHSATEMVRWHSRALEISQKQENRYAQVNSLCWRATIYGGTGNREAAIRDLELATSLAEKCNYMAGKAEALSLLARMHLEEGKVDSADRESSEALVLARKHRLVAKVPQLIADRSEVYQLRGDLDLARVALQKCAAYARADGSEELEMSVCQKLAGILGNPAHAEGQLKRALSLAEKLGHKKHWMIRVELARLEYRQGQYNECAEYLQRALELCRQGNDVRAVACTLNELGVCEVAREDYPTALEHYQEALRLYEKLRTEEGLQRALKERIEAIKLLLQGTATPN